MNQILHDKLRMSAKISKMYFRTKEEARQTLLGMLDEFSRHSGVCDDKEVVDKIMKEIYG